MALAGNVKDKNAAPPLQTNEDEKPNAPDPKPTAPPDQLFDCYNCNAVSKSADFAKCLNPGSETVTCKVGKNGFCWEEAKYKGDKSSANLVEIKRGCFKNLQSDEQKLVQDEKCDDLTNEKNQTIVACAQKCGKNLCNLSASPGVSQGLSTGAIVGIVVGCLAAVILLGGLGYYFYSKKSHDPVPTEDPMPMQ